MENDCQLIVSHHPVIFHPIKSLHADDVPALLMKNGISAICMHTNLDAAPGGVNDTPFVISSALPPKGVRVLPRAAAASGPRCQPLWKRWQSSAPTRCSGVKYVNGQKPVTCLAEVSGGGGSYPQEAIDLGADCLVTGEAAHHIALLAKERASAWSWRAHWGTEHAVADVLAAHIAKQFPQLTVAHAEADKDPYSYLL